jgi:hypothetical protein
LIARSIYTVSLRRYGAQIFALTRELA